eukprot:CAMPEP_0167790886 /NCGR_PEP_ID=MMETSP0111_2-20121227/11592_1 /TAXON_ID=91324 /ORGANISM="Lotharella globosa, Strain CCCM811" /LENGTH=57 /DNA_ID=CAMNT_0007683419 /DNA_START=445 /DNA_END=618 /DNA_ORIENTATION=-
MTSSGFNVPSEAIPTPLLAVPYAAPIFAKIIAEATPPNPKKDAVLEHSMASKTGIIA